MQQRPPFGGPCCKNRHALNGTMVVAHAESQRGIWPASDPHTTRGAAGLRAVTCMPYSGACSSRHAANTKSGLPA